MSEGAHISIVATLNLLRVCLAELDLVFLGMVELFHSVVRFRTAVTIGTLLVKGCVGDVLTYFAGIGSQRPSSVLLGFVVIEALFGVVLVGELALLGFEVVQVYKYHDVTIRAIHLLSFWQ
jgi:hypothetical protein